jgi:ribose transport system permease protein
MKPLGMALLLRIPLATAAAIIVLAVLFVPACQRPEYWLGLPRQDFAPAALALALTPVILTGGIDLSVGSIAVFAAVVIGALWRDYGWPLEAAMAAGVFAGLLVGLGNGTMVAAGVPSLVATLATRELFRGLALGISGDAPVTNFPSSLDSFWRSSILSLPVPLLILAILFLLHYIAVHHTWVGRMVFALGDNERAARFAGLPVGRLKLGIFAWSGLIAGLCGAALVCKYGAAKANAEKTLELTAIACVVMGGVRVTGGAGHVGGTLVGIITVSVLLAAVSDIDPTWRDPILGVALITVALANEAAARFVARYGA